MVTRIGLDSGDEQVQVNSPMFEEYFETPYVRGELIHLYPWVDVK